MEKIRIILDCDPGHDDAVAIMLAANSPAVELLGITVVAGNQTLENTRRNALRVVQWLGWRRKFTPAAAAPTATISAIWTCRPRRMLPLTSTPPGSGTLWRKVCGATAEIEN